MEIRIRYLRKREVDRTETRKPMHSFHVFSSLDTTQSITCYSYLKRNIQTMPHKVPHIYL